jgi:hypothetical protein
MWSTEEDAGSSHRSSVEGRNTVVHTDADSHAGESPAPTGTGDLVGNTIGTRIKPISCSRLSRPRWPPGDARPQGFGSSLNRQRAHRGRSG